MIYYCFYIECVVLVLFYFELTSIQIIGYKGKMILIEHHQQQLVIALIIDICPWFSCSFQKVEIGNGI